MKIKKLTESGFNQAIGVAQVVFMIFLLGYVYTLNKQLSRINKKLATISAAGKKPPETIKLNPDKLSPIIGADKAMVAMTVFSDFECSFCRVFATEIFPRLKEKYVDKGLVRVEFRHLPLSIHKNAFMAAEASACVNEQGKFWNLHDFVFASQQKLSSDLIFNWAGNNKLDTAKLKTCLITHRFKSKVEKDIDEAHRAGLEGTPAIIINGKLTLGARSYDHFADQIDLALAKAQDH